MCEPLVSEPGFALPNKVVAVAVDRDESSKYAVKWAVSYLFPNKNKHHHASLILVHVKKLRNEPGDMNGTSPYGRGESGYDADTSELFKAFRAYSSRKGIQVKEVVITGNDVSKALLEYIDDNIITNIVFGASRRNALQKQSGNHDIPMLVNEFAPAFCTVYVISETEIQFIRPAAVPAASFSSLPKAPYHETVASQLIEEHSEPEDGRDMDIAQQRSKRSEGRRPKNRSTNLSMDTIDTLFRGNKIFLSRHCLGSHKNFPEKQFFESVDNTTQNVNSCLPDSMNGEIQSLQLKDMKAEIRRMKVELKQTRGMYNKVCEKMITAKKKAKNIKEWELHEAHRLAHAQLVRKAAFALVKKERAKGEAATEAAVKAQKVATMEAERRKYAELKIKKEAEVKNRALNVLSNNNVSYRKYTVEEIEVATNYFSDSLKIGEGGYGPVYEGKLDRTRVAIKVLGSGDVKQRKQFQQEVEVLSRMRHPNMVLLIGACPQYGCLVYEYMNNGSLEDRLFRKGNTRPMSWRIRFKVAAELATGLSFLHSARPEPVVHRDLKPANILLDRTYACKISDFGLSRLVPVPVTDSMTASHMTSAVGTSCYVDPEYQQTGTLDVKSDIYSLGIILLQILTARPPMGLIHKVEKSIIEGTFADLLDPAVSRWPIEEALSLAKIALQCVELKKEDRPDLPSVVLLELKRLNEFGGIIN